MTPRRALPLALALFLLASPVRAAPLEFDGPVILGDASLVTWEGIWTYADPSYGALYLAVRQPVGTVVLIGGPAGTLTRTSTDFGPVLRLSRKGRLGDLSADMFLRICGVPLSFGTCPGTLTLVGRP